MIRDPKKDYEFIFNYFWAVLGFRKEVAEEKACGFLFSYWYDHGQGD